MHETHLYSSPSIGKFWLGDPHEYRSGWRLRKECSGYWAEGRTVKKVVVIGQREGPLSLGFTTGFMCNILFFFLRWYNLGCTLHSHITRAHVCRSYTCDTPRKRYEGIPASVRGKPARVCVPYTSTPRFLRQR